MKDLVTDTLWFRREADGGEVKARLSGYSDEKIQDFIDRMQDSGEWKLSVHEHKVKKNRWYTLPSWFWTAAVSFLLGSLWGSWWMLYISGNG